MLKACVQYAILYVKICISRVYTKINYFIRDISQENHGISKLYVITDLVVGIINSKHVNETLAWIIFVLIIEVSKATKNTDIQIFYFFFLQ